MYRVCLLWHFLGVLIRDVLNAYFSQGKQGLEVFHQNTGCQNNIGLPLTLLIFKHWDELKIGDIWQVVLGSVEFNIAPDTLFSIIWWFIQRKSRFCESIVIFQQWTWTSMLSKEMTKPGWHVFFNSLTSFLTAPTSFWHEAEQAAWVLWLFATPSHFSLACIILLFSLVILCFVFVRCASWSFPRVSSFLRMLRFELVNFSLLNLEMDAYQNNKNKDFRVF